MLFKINNLMLFMRSINIFDFSNRSFRNLSNQILSKRWHLASPPFCHLVIEKILKSVAVQKNTTGRAADPRFNTKEFLSWVIENQP